MKDFAKKYLDILENELKGINLTRITNFDDFYNKQILDSVLPVDHSETFRNVLDGTRLLVDIGFGGGFPILPLAYKYKDSPEYMFLGMEARSKKAKAVTTICDAFELSNCTLEHLRCENVFFDETCVITLKAVGKVEDFLLKLSTNSQLYVFFYKGPNFYELEDLSNVLKYWEVIEEKKIDVPGTDGRLLIGFKNKNVPRGTAKFSKKYQLLQKKLVKLSNFL